MHDTYIINIDIEIQQTVIAHVPLKASCKNAGRKQDHTTTADAITSPR